LGRPFGWIWVVLLDRFGSSCSIVRSFWVVVFDRFGSSCSIVLGRLVRSFWVVVLSTTKVDVVVPLNTGIIDPMLQIREILVHHHYNIKIFTVISLCLIIWFLTKPLYPLTLQILQKLMLILQRKIWYILNLR
jgi:hypothetical protein